MVTDRASPVDCRSQHRAETREPIMSLVATFVLNIIVSDLRWYGGHNPITIMKRGGRAADQSEGAACGGLSGLLSDPDFPRQPRLAGPSFKTFVFFDVYYCSGLILYSYKLFYHSNCHSLNSGGHTITSNGFTILYLCDYFSNCPKY